MPAASSAESVATVRTQDAAAMPLHAARGMAAAQACLEAGQAAMAVEVIACTALIDIQKHQGAFLSSAARCRQFAELYAAAFAAAGMSPRGAGETAGFRARQSGGVRRTRVLFVTFQVCEGQAAAASLVRWIELLDPARFETAVICADELTERDPAAGILARGKDRSDRYGPALIERMRRVPSCTGGVTLLPVVGNWVDAAQAGVRAADAFAPDIAAFIASPACPAQAGMAFRRVAPVQLNMNIGACLPIAGMDGIVYHNDFKADDDAMTLGVLEIAQHRVVTIGTDLRGCLSVTPTDRARLGVPKDAVLLASAANQVAPRLLFDGFIDGLIDCLLNNPEAWWVGIGGGETAVLRGRLEEAGVLGRCVLTGPLPDIRPVLAATDILLNEYPEGGGNTVLESMGVGTPVAAMYAGRRHAESIGAILAGEHAVLGGDRRAYWALVERWIRDAGERRRVGVCMRERAHSTFDYTGIVKRYESIFDALVR